MDVIEKDITAIGTIASTIGAAAGGLVAWAVMAAGVGRKYQAIEDRVRQNIKDIEKINNMIDKLHNCFVTADGEPRLVSFAAHDVMQRVCQDRIAERHEMLAQRLKMHDEKLDRILEDLACLRGNAVAYRNPGSTKN